MELWKAVKGYEGLYEVSDKGRIRRTSDYKLLSIYRYTKRYTNSRSSGYCRVMLRRDGVTKCAYVHRLVAISFHGMQKGLEVNHLDGDKSNNALNNLAWSTPKENVRHSFATGLRVPVRGSRHGRSKLNETQIARIRRLGRSLPQVEVAQQFGVSRALVGLILQGKRWAHTAR